MPDEDYMPEGIPGASFDPAVLGAYAAPEGGGPVIDTIEQRANEASGTAQLGHSFDPRAMMGGDSISATFPPTQMSSFTADANQMANGFQSGVENLSGLTASLPASVPGISGARGQPDYTAAPNPLSFSTAPADAGWFAPYAPPQTSLSGVPAPMANYSGGGIPDPNAAAYTPAGSPMASPAGTGMGPAGTPAGGQLPGGGPLDSSAPGAAPPGEPGSLSASVPNADESLASAVASAAAGAGPHAALVAGTVALLMAVAQPGNPNIPGTVQVGGSSVVASGGATASIMATGSEGGGAPQFANNDSTGWFADAVSSWQASHPPQPIPPPPPPAATGAPPTGQAPTSAAPPPGATPLAGPEAMPMMANPTMDPTSPGYTGPYIGPGAAGSTGEPSATNETVGNAVMGKVDGFINSFDKPNPGFNDSFSNEPIWKDPLDANMTHQQTLDEQAKAFAQGGQGFWSRGSGGDIFAGYRPTGGSNEPVVYDNPADAAYVAQQMRAMGADPDSANFMSQDQYDRESGFADDPVTHEPSYDPSDIWKSPLGGISSVGTDAAEGNSMPPTSSWSNRMMTL